MIVQRKNPNCVYLQNSKFNFAVIHRTPFSFSMASSTSTPIEKLLTNVIVLGPNQLVEWGDE